MGKGKIIPGPDLVLVGEGKDNSGLRNRTAEITFLAPGSVVAPWPHQRPPTREEAMAAIMKQLRETMPTRMSRGGVISRLRRDIRRAATGTYSPGGDTTVLWRSRYPSGTTTSTSDGSRNWENQVWRNARERARRRKQQQQEQQEQQQAAAPTPAPTPAPAPAPSLPSLAQLEQIRKEATQVVGRPLVDFLRDAGRSYDTLAGATPELKELFAEGLPTYAQVRRLSPTQQGALRSLLRANEVNDEDFFGAIERDFRGFVPGVRSGQRARIMGMLR